MAGNVDVDHVSGDSCDCCWMFEKREIPLRKRTKGVAARYCNSTASLFWEFWRVNVVRRKRYDELERGKEEEEDQAESSNEGISHDAK